MEGHKKGVVRKLQVGGTPVHGMSPIAEQVIQFFRLALMFKMTCAERFNLSLAS